MSRSDRGSKNTFWRSFYVRIIDSETLDDKIKFRVSKGMAFLACVLIAATFAGLCYVLLAYTPLRTIMPDCDSSYREQEVQLLVEKVNEMEYTIQNQNFYINRIRSLISGRPPEEFTDSINVKEVVSEEFVPVPRSNEDDELRQLVQENINTSAELLAKSTDFGSASAELILDQELYVPVFGSISKSYNPLIGHFGTDIIAPQNTAIKCILPGVVMFSDWSRTTGHTLYIQHAQNLVSVYKHNSGLLKEVGERVQAGEAIAIIGNTGENSTGPHLHFELWHNGNSLNPEDYLNFD